MKTWKAYMLDKKSTISLKTTKWKSQWENLDKRQANLVLCKTE